MKFDELERVDSLVHNVWDAAALLCLEEQPLRYTDLGSQITAWSGRRLSDSTLTQTVKRLARIGMITSVPTNEGGRIISRYHLTDAGSARLKEIRVAVPSGVSDAGEQPTGQPTDGTTRPRRSVHNSTMDPGSHQAETSSGASEPEPAREPRDDKPPTLDTSTPHPARRYNYWLGGKDHFQVDRDSAKEIERLLPSVRIGAQENRRFQQRVVRHLAAEASIRQFLDIGTGLPAPNNTHEIAQAIEPTSRIVYVDNDPLVLVHARALLTGTPQGQTAYLEADLRRPEKILSHPDLLATIDLAKPVGLLLIAVLHFIIDDEDPYGVVARLIEALAPGSFIAITNATLDYMPAEQAAMIKAAVSTGRHGQSRVRSKDEIAQFFTGLELVHPGICSVADWRPDKQTSPPPPDHVNCIGGVARIPWQSARLGPIALVHRQQDCQDPASYESGCHRQGDRRALASP